MHSHDKSIVSQREVYHDTHDYVSALRAALREAPEVILVGEMRDLETIDIAVTAAETGIGFQVAIRVGAANTIDRMIDVFPPSQQQQIRVQLAMVLNAVISQQLVPGIDGKMIPVFEIMICNQAIRTLIRDGKRTKLIMLYLLIAKLVWLLWMMRSLIYINKIRLQKRQQSCMHQIRI